MAVKALGIAALVVLVGLAAPVAAQPASDVLRDGNAAATAGDWTTVDKLVQPLLAQQLASADLAEAHRLAGLAAYFGGDRPTAEIHFLAYLRIDLDGQLDPSLYPPEAITFFVDVKAKHNAELRARRKLGKKRYWIANLLPPLGQLQNGDRTKAIVVGSLIGVFLVGNITSYVVLKTWCDSDQLTCDDPENRVESANRMKTINLVTTIGLIVSYAYGVYDGVQGYRRTTREQRIQPFVAQTAHESFIGVAGSF